jgi:hypothetical protein
MTRFTVTHLHAERIADAFPLVRMAAPEVSLDQWGRYADWLCRADGGVLAAYAGNGTLHGIAAYCRDDSLRYGRALRTDLIVTFELSRDAPARSALLEALALIALAKGCENLTVSMPGRGYANPQSEKAAPWAGLGFALDSVTFTTRIEPKAVERMRKTSRLREPLAG